MTVSSTTSRSAHEGDGVSTVFAVPFYFLRDADLKVVLADDQGAETVQTLALDYTVSGAGEPVGGSIAMATAPSVGWTIVVLRDIDALQETDFEENADLPADTLERGFDRLTMLMQQMGELIARAILLPTTSSLTGIAFPEPEAGKLVVGNETGTGFLNKTPAESGQVVYPIAIADGGTGATTAAAARDSLGVSEAPAGVIQMYGGVAAPAGWLLCDGAAVSRGAYADLFAAIGTAFGPGDGATTFNLPDLAGGFPRGTGGGVVPGAVGGSATVAIEEANLPPHTHDGAGLSAASGGSHSHATGITSSASGGGGSYYWRTPDGFNRDSNTGQITSTSAGGHSHAIAGTTGATGSGAPLGVLPPFVGLTFIIKT